MVNVVAYKQHIHNCTQYCWPFPAECPPKPWTREQVEEYNKQQRDKTPEAPM